MKKKVVIFANCQSGAIGKTLEEVSAFKEEYMWLKLPSVQDIKE